MVTNRNDYSDNHMVKILVRTAMVAAAVALPVGAAPQSKPEAPTAATELERMQGTWDYESQTIGGRELPADRRAKIWVVIDGDTRTRETGLGPGLKDKITLDPSASPRTIDLVSVGHPSGRTFTEKGIYEWDGKLLRLCLDNTGKDRPKEFKSPAGQDNIYVSVLRRRAK
jgi:uncharacterized protein (TIGR03067 family)